MNLIVGSEEDILRKIKAARIRLDKCTNQQEKIVLAGYISELLTFADRKEKIKNSSFYLSKDYKRYQEYVDFICNYYDDDLFHNKCFYSKFTGSLIDAMADSLIGFDDLYTRLDEGYRNVSFSKSDFTDIMYGFSESVGMSNEFKELIERKHLYVFPCCNNFLGFTLNDYSRGKFDVILSSLNYTLEDMFVLAHEFGHGYDLLRLPEFAGNNLLLHDQNYMYGEAFSVMFERLFTTYLIDNNIEKDDVKNLSLTNLYDIYLNILLTNILLQLPDEYLVSDKYKSMEMKDILKFSDGLYEAIGDDDIPSIEEFTDEDSISFRNNFIYGFGGIFSVFLDDSVRRDGLDNELVRAIMRQRACQLDEDFFDRYNLTGENFQKLYTKKLEQCKK